MLTLKLIMHCYSSDIKITCHVSVAVLYSYQALGKVQRKMFFLLEDDKSFDDSFVKANSLLGAVSRGKTADLLDFVQITSPPPPSRKFGQLVTLFSDVKIQDLKVSLDLKILYILYNMLYIYNLNKKQLKIQIIGILEGVDSFY